MGVCRIGQRVACAVLVLMLSGAIAPPVWAGGGGAFEGAGGPVFISALLDLSELERSFHNLIEMKGDLEFNGKPIFLMGGGAGFGGGNETRFGGIGGGGHWSLIPTGTAEFNRATLELGWGGFLMDQLLIEGNVGALSVGAVIGGGSWTLHVSKDPQGEFGDLVIKPPLYLELHRSFWLAMPYVSAEFKIFAFVGLRVSAGFWLSISLEEWKLPDDRVVPGGPLKGMIFPVFQVMLAFGG